MPLQWHGWSSWQRAWTTEPEGSALRAFWRSRPPQWLQKSSTAERGARPPWWLLPFRGFLAASCGGFRAGGAFWNHITWVTAAPAHSWQAAEATILAEYSSALWQVKQWQVSSQKQNDVLFILQSISRNSPAGVETAWDWEQRLGARTSEQDYGDGCSSVADTGQLWVLTAVASPDKRRHVFFFFQNVFKISKTGISHETLQVNCLSASWWQFWLRTTFPHVILVFHWLVAGVAQDCCGSGTGSIMSDSLWPHGL